jgi:hypothetical protein
MNMSEREKQLETILMQLFESHFFGKELEWSHIEGKGLLDVDRELYIQLLYHVPQIMHNK